MSIFVAWLVCVPEGHASDAVQALIVRTNPAHANRIDIHTSKPGANGKDAFQIVNKDGRLQISGANPRCQASAYGWYLKHIANQHLSWGGDQLTTDLPLPSAEIARSTPYRFRFAYNYCTLSYTMAFWDWPRWEREIDQLAMQGYTHALVTAGLEKVWQLTLRELNYPEAEIQKFIPNPAFAAWWNMGNLEGHGGPLTQNLIDGEAKLGRQIVTRMKELGITPTLAGFVGILPSNIGQYNPKLRLVPQGDWVGFKRPTVLDPTSADYPRIAAIWYKNLHEVYGSPSKAYGGDLFHEGGSHGNIDVTAAARAVQSAMQKASPGATWVLQSWHNTPSEDLLRGTDPEKTLILQLCRNMKDGNNGGPLRTFQNHPWLYSELANFGGNHNLYGGNHLAASLPSHFLDPAKNIGDMAGLGLLSEGVETNPFYYAIFHDAFWRDKDIDLAAWIPAYAERRYGTANQDAVAALFILNESVYKPAGMQEGCTESILCAKPARNARKASTWSTGEISYNPTDVIDAAESLLKAAPALRKEATYRYDLVDVTRQVLADVARPTLAAAMDAYDHKDVTEFKTYAKLYIDLIRDTDELLASDAHWLLGNWIERARAKGGTLAERELMETAARRQITTWSSKPDALDDYSNRQWAGLMKDYYLQRWLAFFTIHLDVLEGRKPAASIPSWHQDLRAKEDVAFASERKKYPTKASGDTVVIATRILTHYAPIARKLWGGRNQGDGLRWQLGNQGELVFDVSEVFISEGTYQCIFQWETGENALRIHSLALYEGDQKITEDIHGGWTGIENDNNSYTIRLNKLRVGLDAYTLRAAVSGEAGNNSQGILKIKKLK